jgi:hypothetical protein
MPYYLLCALGIARSLYYQYIDQSFPICDHAMWFKRVLLAYYATSVAVTVVTAANSKGKSALGIVLVRYEETYMLN